MLSCASPSKTVINNELTNPHFSQIDTSTLSPKTLQHTKVDKINLVPNTLDPGIIIETGLLLGNTTYSMLIEPIDENTLLSMPKMKIEDKHLYIPNHTIVTKPNRD